MGGLFRGDKRDFGGVLGFDGGASWRRAVPVWAAVCFARRRPASGPWTEDAVVTESLFGRSGIGSKVVGALTGGLFRSTRVLQTPSDLAGSW
jgi:hypothetical protein